jgi:hypothetical protein
MNENFKYQCRRRYDSIAELTVAELGAGSGGDEGDGNNGVTCEGHYGMSAAGMSLVADGGSGENAQSPLIWIQAGISTAPTAGRVAIHANQNVRITSGGMAIPNNVGKSQQGVNINVDETQQIYLKRGILPTDNFFQLTPSLTVLDAGSTPMMISSDVAITLQVANGTSKIMLTPTGITIQGLLTQINP